MAAGCIDYVHAGGLGNPPDIRELYLGGKPEEGHRAFRRHLSNGAGAALEELVASIGDKRIALLCLERDARVCHRSVVAHMVAERAGGERAVIDLEQPEALSPAQCAGGIALLATAVVP